MGWLSIAAGALMLIVPIVYPSQDLAAPVFLGFIFVLDPINAHVGAESLRGTSCGALRGAIDLLAAGSNLRGAVGVLELLGRSRNGSTTSRSCRAGDLRDAGLGYGGFPAFAVECFTMYVALRT